MCTLDLTEKYTLYRLAFQLMYKDHYELIYFNDSDDEVWLQKRENRKTKIIRLLHKHFDWKNHLKKDIAQVFHKIKIRRNRYYEKNIEIFNIYVTSLAPVDQWEYLKKPLHLKEKNPLKMNVYYLDEGNFEEEQKRFVRDAKSSIEITNEYPMEQEQQEEIHHYKSKFASHIYQKRKEIENIFSFGKPRFTYVLIFVNIMMFFALESSGGSMNIENLIKFGAKYNAAIVEGEWWRIITSMFLHIGMIHLLMNMIAIYYLGIIVERIYGSTRFLMIYFLAGIGGGVASFGLNDHISAGASGALFGLFGALLFFGVIYKRIFLETMGVNLLFILGINIIISFTIPQIDIGAHIGGLIAGFISSVICYLPGKSNVLFQVLGVILYILFVAIFIFVAFLKLSPS